MSQHIQTEMRVAVINFSGNTGKTTVARHLLAPRIDDAGEIIYIESANSDKETDEGKKLRAAQFERVAQKLMESLSCVVDIGASNVEQTLQMMAQIDGSHLNFDYFVIPVTQKPKQRTDSVNTVEHLLKLGVSPDKIKVVFNQVGLTEDINDVFGDVIYVLSQLNVGWDKDAVIYENNFFPRYQESKMTLEELFSTSLEENRKRQNDLRRIKNKSPKEKEELRTLVSLINLQSMAQSAVLNCDKVFEALFTEEVVDDLDES